MRFNIWDNLKRAFTFRLRRGAGQSRQTLPIAQHDDSRYDEEIDVVERARRARPTLVGAEHDAGVSRVRYRGYFIPLHLFTNDFFISVVQLPSWVILVLVAGVYTLVFLIWSLIWWLIVAFYPGCLYGASTYVESLAFATITQMTIGYGNTGPQACWVATWLIIVQSILAVVLEAVTLGIVFARISHPHQRARSIFISDKAVIARRDGILKFMFRVADIRATQVVEPKVKAYLYTWGDGRVTAEGERVPVRVEALDVDYIDGMLLLPLIIEHTIDERSPLCGHTHDSLAKMNAEIVVTFEGTTEMGNPFMARRSYIPENILWGHQFANIVETGLPHYEVNLENFHRVERQKEMPDLHSSHLSNLVVHRAKRTVPYPLLGENTLVLSDVLCVAPNEDGELCLLCRVADTYPNQMLEITVKMLLYRWKDPSNTSGIEAETFQQFNLECGYSDGSDRLHLRLPTVVKHVIDDSSPLAAWMKPGGLDADMQSEIVVVINAYMNVNNNNILRQRTYNVDHHVKWGCGFVPMVVHPARSQDGKPRIRWHKFHSIQIVEGMEAFPSLPSNDYTSRRASGLLPEKTGISTTAVPESHGSLASLTSKAGEDAARQTGGHKLPPYFRRNPEIERNDFTVMPTVGLQRYEAAMGMPSQASMLPERARGTFVLFPDVVRFAEDTMDASDSLPHPAALHPALPGPDRFRMGESDKADETAKAEGGGAVETRPGLTGPEPGRPVERQSTERAVSFGGRSQDAEDGAGSALFGLPRTRSGAKSLKEISSLFKTELPQDDDEGGV